MDNYAPEKDPHWRAEALLTVNRRIFEWFIQRKRPTADGGDCHHPQMNQTIIIEFSSIMIL
jgi:hypothetical protein